MSVPYDVVILDLDNCISDDSWRIRFIDWAQADLDARYEAYHACAYYDRADTRWVLDAISKRQQRVDAVRIFIITARPVMHAELTQRWLDVHCKNLPVAGLLMRGHGDHRHSAELKCAQLASLLDPNNGYDVALENIIFAADDRPEVCAMYEEFGIPTINHALHSLDAFQRSSDAAPDLLRSAARTFEQRNAVYGDNYKRVGDVMAALFPDGVTLQTPEQFNIWHLFELMIVKLTRFSNGRLEHEDSIHDLIVYGAMVQSLIKKGLFK